MNRNLATQKGISAPDFLQAVQQHYHTCQATPDYQAADWAKPEHLENAIAAQLSVIPEQCQSLLDLGCGRGGIYAAVQQRGSNWHYLGIDLMPQNIEICQQRYPQGQWQVGNYWEALAQPEAVDWIVSNGCLFSHTRPQDRERLLTALLAKARLGFSVICLLQRPGQDVQEINASPHLHATPHYWFERSFKRLGDSITATLDHQTGLELDPDNALVVVQHSNMLET
ncbi:trans-aconitate 2-methyltransferase [Leptolyngbya sp. FACHB-261]|uniref:class I SAM-dependent methyltransferase n=1 Tax=Leptolyngbya sp. FACHB-261 TaxID=2692806 RepID=UPI0016838325|nr:class I SAM-dependent methyltransferase [Leptolyngbya sp. FACHB-261]MBD2103350.1 class I SAM-dependent methyltransferase [Leptolyngbya sp. FACHB-261]